jgi:hypothetical protein
MFPFRRHTRSKTHGDPRASLRLIISPARDHFPSAPAAARLTLEACCPTFPLTSNERKRSVV